VSVLFVVSMKLCLFVKARFCVSCGLFLPCCWESKFKHGVVEVQGCFFNEVVFVCLSHVLLLVLGWLANVVGNRGQSKVLC
jgi:cytochrome c biogenesis factor